MGELIDARKEQEMIQDKIQKKTDIMLINMMSTFVGAPCDTDKASQCFKNEASNVDECLDCITMLGCPLPANFEKRYNSIHIGDLTEMSLVNLVKADSGKSNDSIQSR